MYQPILPERQQSMLPNVAGLFEMMMSIRPTPIGTELKAEDGLYAQSKEFNNASLSLRREHGSIVQEGYNLLKKHGGSMEAVQKAEIEKIERGEPSWFERISNYQAKEEMLFNASNIIKNNEQLFNDSFKRDKDKMYQVSIDPHTRGPQVIGWKEDGRPIFKRVYHDYQAAQSGLGFHENGMPAQFIPPHTVDPNSFNQEVKEHISRIGSSKTKRFEGDDPIFGTQVSRGVLGEETRLLLTATKTVSDNAEQIMIAQNNVWDALSIQAKDAVSAEYYDMLERGYPGVVLPAITEDEDGNPSYEKEDDGSLKMTTRVPGSPEEYAWHRVRQMTQHMRSPEDEIGMIQHGKVGDSSLNRKSLYTVVEQLVDAEVGTSRIGIQVANVNEDGGFSLEDVAAPGVENYLGGVVANMGGVANELTEARFKMTPDELKTNRSVTLESAGMPDVISTTFGPLSFDSSNTIVVGYGNRVAQLPVYEKENGKLIPKPQVVAKVKANKDGSTETIDVINDGLYVEVELSWNSKPTIGGVFPGKDGMEEKNIKSRDLENYKMIENRNGKWYGKFWVPVNEIEKAFWPVDSKNADKILAYKNKELNENRKRMEDLEDVGQPLNE